jgi:hypothetical protein
VCEAFSFFSGFFLSLLDIEDRISNLGYVNIQTNTQSVRMLAYASCNRVSDQCPVSETVLGYTPSLPINATLLAMFSLVIVAQLVKGTHYRTWTFMTAMLLGSACLVMGESNLYVLVWSGGLTA